jgi:adenosylcobinamide kinase/adenosylcobinamide-phosphate guanylyltransferase
MKPRVIAFIGGIRSGKSDLAQARFQAELKARKLKAPAYLATLLTGKAQKPRIDAHQAARPATWATVEVGAQLPAAGQACLRGRRDAWLLDGLGAWAALRLTAKPGDVEAELAEFLALPVPLLVLVLDEVGQGGVPGHPAARAFADLNGSLNRQACEASDQVFSVQAGLALRLK